MIINLEIAKQPAHKAMIDLRVQLIVLKAECGLFNVVEPIFITRRY